MRLIILCALQFVFWSALYTITSKMNEDRFVLAAFAFTLVISMVTASVFLAKPRE